MAYWLSATSRPLRRNGSLDDSSAPDKLPGTGDIQPLADLTNSYALVNDMRFVPFGLKDISRLVAATDAPLLPLLLTIFSPEELLTRGVKVIL